MSTSVRLSDCRVEGGFWGAYQQLIFNTVLPYQWEALNDRIQGAEKSHSLHNLRIAAGLDTGVYEGPPFQDSDLYKWLEAAAYRLSAGEDQVLLDRVEAVLALLEKAQWPDGYLNSYITLVKPDKRFANLRDEHELYCAGHFIEAAVALKDIAPLAIAIAVRLADCIDNHFGPDKCLGYPGHPELELALMKLYHATGQPRYLAMAAYFINQRGQCPNYFDLEAKARGESGDIPWAADPHRYFQAHQPVRDQQEAVGHCVRALYLYAGMAELAAATGEASLKAACQTLWNSVVHNRMYITGGVGSERHGEAFSVDYDLPGETAYAETCASVALVFLARRLLDMELSGGFGDEMERALYNGVLSGMAQDGRSFFYVNPLSVWPEALNRNDHNHVKHRRQPWLGCACCPPNLARLLASLPLYAYGLGADDAIQVHLYCSGSVNFSLNGGAVTLNTRTGYPYDGRVDMTLGMDAPRQLTLRLRIPGWCTSFHMTRNRELIDAAVADGYADITGLFAPGDTLSLVLNMPVRRVYARAELRDGAGKVTLMRGPLVYCLEQADNGPGLAALSLSRDEPLLHNYQEVYAGVHTVTLHAQGFKDISQTDALYAEQPPLKQPVLLTFIPYYLWANRAPGEMTVMIREV